MLPKSELEQVSGKCLVIGLKVRLEAFPNGSPMSVCLTFLKNQGKVAERSAPDVHLVLIR